MSVCSGLRDEIFHKIPRKLIKFLCVINAAIGLPLSSRVVYANVATFYGDILGIGSGGRVAPLSMRVLSVRMLIPLSSAKKC